MMVIVCKSSLFYFNLCTLYLLLQGFLSTSILGCSMSFLEESQSETDPVLSVEYLHGESPSVFTCQLSSSKHKLEALMEELNKCGDDKESTVFITEKKNNFMVDTSYLIE